MFLTFNFKPLNLNLFSLLTAQTIFAAHKGAVCAEAEIIVICAESFPVV